MIEDEKNIPTLSVIVPTFNRKSVLAKTLSQLCRQTISKELYEVIVIDDSSIDGTCDYLRDLKLPINFSFICNEMNLGRAKTRNKGIRAAKGRYVVMIDDDIWVTETFVEEHFKVHRKSSKEVAVAGAILVARNIENTAVNERCNDHHVWCYEEMKRHTTSLPYGFCKTANLSLPRGLFNNVGLFNESFIHYGGEDTEFGYRLMQRGVKLIFAENAIGYHFHSESVNSLISKEIERAKSNNVYQRLHPGIIEARESFFSPYYNKGFKMRAILYNPLKALLFTTIARKLNYNLTIFFNDKKTFRKLLVKYLIPLLQVQYLRMSLRRKEA